MDSGETGTELEDETEKEIKVDILVEAKRRQWKRQIDTEDTKKKR